MRIVGPPGTGKTTWLKNKVEELSVYYKADEFCLTSFTKSAAKVLSERIENIENCGTLHALCYKNVGRPEIAESKKGIDLWNKENPSMQLSHSSKVSIDDPFEDATLSSESDLIFNEIKVLRSRMIEKESWSARQLKLWDKWEKFKFDNEFWDFTDMVEHNLRYVAQPPDNPKIFIVDEAQDLTRLEMSLVKKWAKTVDQFFIAGDADQCLYSFKGSDPVDFITLNEDVEVLEQSWRVPFFAHMFANRIIKKCKNRDDISYRPRNVEGELNFLTLRFNDLAIIKSVEKDINKGKTVMLLTSCGYMLDSIVKNLKQAGIPFHNPYRIKQGAWNPIKIGTRGQVSSADCLRAWTSKYVDTYEMFLKWQKPLKRVVFNKGFNEELKDINKEKFKFVWNHYVSEELKYNLRDVNWYISNVLSTKKNSLEYPAKLFKSGHLDDEIKVIVGTIHSVKGGESDIVYLFPDVSGAAMDIGVGDELHRLFYVGATRCKETLNLCQPTSWRAYNWK